MNTGETIMSTGIRLSPAEMERLIKQAHDERAQFMRKFMRNNSKRLLWTAGTFCALCVASVSFHPIG
jgi:hypothetical protein